MLIKLMQKTSIDFSAYFICHKKIPHFLWLYSVLCLCFLTPLTCHSDELFLLKPAIDISDLNQLEQLQDHINFWQPQYASAEPLQATQSFYKALNMHHTQQWLPFDAYPGNIFSQDQVWFSLRLKNSSTLSKTFIYKNSLMPIHKHQWILSDGKNILTKAFFGTAYPRTPPLLDGRVYAIAFDIPAQSERILFLRSQGLTLQSIKSATIIQHLPTLRHDSIDQQIWFFTGTNIVLFLLSLIFYYYSHKSYNLCFALILLNGMFIQWYYNGLGPTIISPNWAYWNEKALIFHALLGFILLFLFSNRYLHIRQYLPKVRLFYLLLIAAISFNLLILLILPFTSAMRLLIIVAAIAYIGLILLFPIAAFLWHKGYKSARNFTFIWGAYIFISAILFAMYQSDSNLISSHQYFLYTQFVQSLVATLLLLSMINNLDEAKEKRQLAEAESHAKSDFLAKMSHEIRTPMSGILGMSELMAETEMNEQQTNYNDMIYRSGRHLLSVINDVLDYSKISAGKMELEVIEFNVARMAKDVMGIFSIMIRDKNIDFVCRLAPDIPIYWMGDENRIRQIIINLLGNAIKFTHSGEILVDIDFTMNPAHDENKEISPAYLLNIAVKDSGIGIKESVQKSIFDDFNQADTSTSRTYGGTGLGLSICKQLAQLMGGDIQLKSRMGIGSTFSVHIPLDAKSGETYKIPSVLKKLSLLLVDDNESYRKVVIERLQDSNIDLQIAHNAYQALKIIQDRKDDGRDFDIISLDIEMPDMDGISLAQQIMQQQLSSAAILLLSAVRTIPPQAEYQSYGVNYAAQKPVLASELIPLFVHTLGLQQGKSADEEKAVFKPQVSSRHILVAEDNDVNYQVISILLKKQKHRVQRAENGLQALELFKSCNLQNNNKGFDIILMDCEMPEMDGYQATVALRELEKEYQLTHIPIIALTAHAVKDHLNKCLLCGMDEVITKPFNQQQITQLFIRLFH